VYFSSHASSVWKLNVLHKEIIVSGTNVGAYKAAGLAAARAALQVVQLLLVLFAVMIRVTLASTA
jgi:hypothetical protein